MATVDVIANRSGGTEALGKAYFETDTNSFIVYNGSGWVELQSDGVGAAAPFNQYSLSLDGTDDYIQLPNGVLSTLQGTAWSISAWYNLDVVGNYQELFTAGTYLQVYFRPRAGSQVGLELYVNGALTLLESQQNGNYSPIQTWIHGVISVDTNGTSVMYINGQSSQTSGSVPQPTTVSNPVISSFNGVSNFLDGKVDDFALFNTALSASDVTAIYNGGVPADLTSYSPVGWWRMGDDPSDSPTNDGAVSSIQDSSGNGNHATQSTASSQPTFSTDVPA